MYLSFMSQEKKLIEHKYVHQYSLVWKKEIFPQYINCLLKRRRMYESCYTNQKGEEVGVIYDWKYTNTYRTCKSFDILL